ncbi:MAG: hypothetical protein L0K86_05215 [Actinomycetia bacterium]|nr:hypothetical protein [Actinomycetes bacterium]
MKQRRDDEAALDTDAPDDDARRDQLNQWAAADDGTAAQHDESDTLVR